MLPPVLDSTYRPFLEILMGFEMYFEDFWGNLYDVVWFFGSWTGKYKIGVANLFLPVDLGEVGIPRWELWQEEAQELDIPSGFPGPAAWYEVDAPLKLQHVFVRELKTQSTMYIVLYI